MSVRPADFEDDLAREYAIQAFLSSRRPRHLVLDVLTQLELRVRLGPAPTADPTLN